VLGGAPVPEDHGGAALLVRLSSDDWKQRQQAEEDLVRGGESARPLIRRWLDGPGAALDAETRSRLEAALRRIDDNRAAGPSFVTLHMKDAPPAEVAAELFRQAGAEARTSPDDLWDQGRWPRVTLDADRQPFWAVLKEFLGKTGVGLSTSDEGLYLLGAPGLVRGGAWQVSGPFLVAVTEISRTQRLVPAAQADGGAAGEASRTEDFAAQLVVLAEPKVAVVRGPDVPRMEEAVDDKGNSLRPLAVRAGEVVRNNGGLWTYRVQLKYPQDAGTRIARFKGSATFAVQTKFEQVEVPDLTHARDVERRLKDVRVIVSGIQPQGGRDEYELKLVLFYEGLSGGAAGGVGGGVAAGPQGRWARVQRALYEMQNRLRVVDAAGQALERRGFGSRVNGDEVEITVRFAPSWRPRDRRRSGEPAKLVWQVPTATKEVEAAFEFRDLPMP
jgi:hypothetical protein